MASITRKTLRTLGIVLAVAVVIGGVKFVEFVLPGEPSEGHHVRFDGSIKLPRANALNVLDYMLIDDGSLYVASETSGAVYKIPVGAVFDPEPAIATFAGPPAAHGVAVADSTGTAFVTRSEANVVDAFDPVKMAKIASIKVADDADAIIYDRAADLLYVASGDANMGTLIDPHTRAVVAVIPLGGKPEFPVWDSKAGIIYDALRDRDQIVVIDVATHAIVGRWSVPGCLAPTGMAMDFANRVVFAACGGNARIAVFDMDSHAVLATMPIGAHPDVVAFDPALHRVYAAGKDGKFDVIEQISRVSYRTLDRISTHFGAHSLTFDPRTHKVYVGYASLLAAPRLAVFSSLP